VDWHFHSSVKVMAAGGSWAVVEKVGGQSKLSALLHSV
jgi:hypothetical protein